PVARAPVAIRTALFRQARHPGWHRGLPILRAGGGRGLDRLSEGPRAGPGTAIPMARSARRESGFVSRVPQKAAPEGLTSRRLVVSSPSRRDRVSAEIPNRGEW